MCGRYVSPEQAAVERAWQIGRSNSNPFKRRFNVAPTTAIPLLRGNPATRALELVGARWGFIPAWWKQSKSPTHTINARSEEAAGKPMWRHAYRHARCLIPAEGWYEWKTAERVDSKTGEVSTFRQPYFIYRPDRALIAFAGIMSMWAPEGGDLRLTCAILTRPAAPSVEAIHDRMPVVLRGEAFDAWLDADRQGADDVAAMIGRAEIEFMHHRVSTRLNAGKVDDETLIAAA